MKFMIILLFFLLVFPLFSLLDVGEVIVLSEFDVQFRNDTAHCKGLILKAVCENENFKFNLLDGELVSKLKEKVKDTKQVGGVK